MENKNKLLVVNTPIISNAPLIYSYIYNSDIWNIIRPAAPGLTLAK